MGRDEKISLFLRKYTQEQREILDYISGFIFEFFPSINEEIREDSLKYKSAQLGSMFLLKVKENIVYFYISKKNIKNKENNNSHFLYRNKNFYYFKFDNYKRIKRHELVDVFQLII